MKNPSAANIYHAKSHAKPGGCGSRRRLYSSLWEAFFSVGGLWEGDCPEVSWTFGTATLAAARALDVADREVGLATEIGGRNWDELDETTIPPIVHEKPLKAALIFPVPSSHPADHVFLNCLDGRIESFSSYFDAINTKPEIPKSFSLRSLRA